MKTFPNRSFFFALAVAVHLLAFWLLSGLKFITPQAASPKEPQFLLVKLPAPAAPPPLPPFENLAGSMSIPSPVVAPQPTVAAVMPISTQSLAAFNVPIPKIPNLRDHLPTTGSVVQGDGKGDGTGGTGEGDGQGVGDGNGLAGIGREEHLIAVADISTSMTEVTLKIRSQLAADYPNAYLVRSSTAYGKFIETADKHPVMEYGSTGDLYAGALLGLSQHPDATAVYILTDFEDGGDDEATYAFVDNLRKKRIKLFICSVEVYPYDGLVQYAYESGGGYLQMTKKAITSFKPH